MTIRFPTIRFAYWTELALSAAAGTMVAVALMPAPAHASLFGKKKPVEDFSTVRPAPMPMQPVAQPVQPNGGIFQASDGYAALYEGWRARKVGDPLTIVLVERTAASKSANSSSAPRAIWVWPRRPPARWASCSSRPISA